MIESTLDDEYIRAKLDEAQASIDRGEAMPWNVGEVKAEVRKRLADQ